MIMAYRRLYISRDGIAWDEYTAPSLRDIYYIDGKYVGVLDSDAYISNDGYIWEKITHSSSYADIDKISEIFIKAQSTTQLRALPLVSKNPDFESGKAIIPKIQKDTISINSAIMKIDLDFQADKVFLNMIGNSTADYKKYGDIFLSRKDPSRFKGTNTDGIKITNSTSTSLDVYDSTNNPDSVGKITDTGFEIYDPELRLNGVMFEYVAIGNKYE